MKVDGKLDYLELPAGGDIAAAKRFYEAAFGWRFIDYGPTYAGFDEGLDGGFQADAAEAPKAPLPVIFAADLDAMFAKVQAAGATVVKPIFAFPGGRRFHVTDPAGNEIACVSYD